MVRWLGTAILIILEHGKRKLHFPLDDRSWTLGRHSANIDAARVIDNYLTWIANCAVIQASASPS